MTGEAIGKWLMLLMVCLVHVACDGYIKVTGQVYEWLEPEPGAIGFAMVDAIARRLPTRLVPLEGAEIIMEPWTPAERTGKPDVWIKKANTDKDGQFQLSGTVKPGWFDATLTIRHPGFMTVEQIFRHDRFDQRAIVILCREAEGATLIPQNNQMQRTSAARAMDARR